MHHTWCADEAFFFIFCCHLKYRIFYAVQQQQKNQRRRFIKTQITSFSSVIKQNKTRKVKNRACVSEHRLLSSMDGSATLQLQELLITFFNRDIILLKLIKFFKTL